MDDRIAVITGVSRGLGESLAACLLERGFLVIGVGRGAAKRLASPRFRLAIADLSDTAALPAIAERLFTELAAHAASQRVLVNNAAVAGPIGTVGSLVARETAESIAINLTAPLMLANAFVRAFHGLAGDRRVINVSSGAATQPVPGVAVYCAGKAALEMMTAAMAAEAATSGVVSIAVRPGLVDTPMQAHVRSQPRERLPVVDMFKEFHASGQLVAPDVTARRIVERLVVAPTDNGRVYSYAEL
jgi:NAD(P)-dependent dehydrogenase (short-subunit alcohol dehydrogenase family)